MPLLNSVTTPYAEALLQVVNENSQTEEMVSEVKQLLELINDSPELEKALSSPILETDAKKKIINEIFSKKVNSSLLNFLKLLADRQRIGILTSILDRFLEIYRENSNRKDRLIVRFKNHKVAVNFASLIDQFSSICKN